MLRILIAMLLLAGCTTTSPPPPTATAPPTPTQTPRRQPPPPPPKDWLEVLVDSLGHRVPPSGGESKTFSYRDRPTTMYVVFNNVGDEPITAPKITFALEQREPTPELGTELETHFAGATGEGWKCSGSPGTRTCASKATVAPGEAMPTIELEIKPVAPRSTRTHFTASHGDLLYEAVVHYDTSI